MTKVHHDRYWQSIAFPYHVLTALIILNMPRNHDILRSIGLVPQNELILASINLLSFSWILVVIETIGNEQARSFYLIVIIGDSWKILRANLNKFF